MKPVIGVFTHPNPDLQAPYFAGSLRGVSAALDGFSHELLINPSPEAPQAFIFLGPADGEPALLRAIARKLPGVVLQGVSDVFPSVGMDNISAARTVVDHLLVMGRKRVAVINGRLYVADGKDRFEGYKQALASHGRPFDPALAPEAEFDRAKGRAAMLTLLSLPVPPDAVFAANDHMALGALEALKQSGRRVPEDVAVAGFDDMPEAAVVGLTSFRQPFEKIAFEGTRLLKAWLSGERSPGAIRLSVEGELVTRASCGSNAVAR